MVRSVLVAMMLGILPVSAPASTDLAGLSSIPIAPPSDPFTVEGTLSASGVIVLDAKTGQQLFAREPLVQRPMASLTKLMTALIIVENHDLMEVVTIPRSVADVVGNRAYLSPGKKYYLGDVLSALLINSGNDAALTLALYHSGSVPEFAREMNRRALQLGLTGTSFKNPSGIDDPSHWSTPRDIAWLSNFVLQQEPIARRMGMSGARIASIDGSEVLSLYHTHSLMHSQTDIGANVIAGKTGTTSDAGECLMSVVHSGDHEYVVVLLGSHQRYEDMRTLLTSIAHQNAAPAPLAAQ